MKKINEGIPEKGFLLQVLFLLVTLRLSLTNLHKNNHTHTHTHTHPHTHTHSLAVAAAAASGKSSLFWDERKRQLNTKQRQEGVKGDQREKKSHPIKSLKKVFWEIFFLLPEKVHDFPETCSDEFWNVTDKPMESIAISFVLLLVCPILDSHASDGRDSLLRISRSPNN